MSAESAERRRRGPFRPLVVALIGPLVIGAALFVISPWEPTHILTAQARPAAAPSPDTVVNGVDQQSLQACIAANTGNCETKVPGLQACMVAKLVCNAAAAPVPQETLSPLPVSASCSAFDQNTIPVADASKARMTFTEADALATPYTSSPGPAVSTMVIPASVWAGLCGPHGEQSATASGDVWIATVNAPLTALGNIFSGPLPSIQPSGPYSAIIDDQSGSVLVVCTASTSGCPIVTS